MKRSILGSSHFSGTCRNFFIVCLSVYGREENQEGIRSSIKLLFQYKRSFSSRVVKARRGLGVGKREMFCLREGINI